MSPSHPGFFTAAGLRGGVHKTAQMLRLLIAAVPIAALTIAVPLVNRVEPRVAGLPFLLCWIIAWVLLTPAFLWTIGRLEQRW